MVVWGLGVVGERVGMSVLMELRIGVRLMFGFCGWIVTTVMWERYLVVSSFVAGKLVQEWCECACEHNII